MHVRAVRVKNLRAVRDCTLALGRLTALVGPNGAGKSTFLHALELFQGTTPVCQEDYYNGDTGRDIEIQVAFGDLRDSEAEAFAEHAKNGELCVAHTIRWERGKARHFLRSYSLSDPRIDAVLGAPDAATARSLYARLLESPRYEGLPAWPGFPKARDALQNWKSQHPEKCDIQYGPEEFFGNSMMGAARLAEHVWFIRVHAVRDAAGAGPAGRGPALEELLDAIVQRAHARGAGAGGGGAAVRPRLAKLKAAVSRTLSLFAPGERVEIEYSQSAGSGGRAPRARARLVEGGYSSPVGAAGHGLQRAFIAAAALHQLPHMQAPGGPYADAPPDPPAIVLAIEEPELYQHPTRLHHIAGQLRALSEGGLEGVAGGIQVVYTTHSPLLVSADRIDQLRLVKKAPGGAGASYTIVCQTSLDRVAKELEAKAGVAQGAPGGFTAETLAARLQAIMTPWMNEGFFSKAVVLVEGEADRAVITGYLSAKGLRADSMDISVIPCGGKASIDRPALIFQSLGIPTYAVWDCDKNKKETERGETSNKLLLSLFGRDYEGPGTLVGANFACFEDNMTATLKLEFGSPFTEALTRHASNLGFEESRAMKNAHVIAKTVSDLGADDLKSPTLERMMERITGLTRRPVASGGWRE